MVPVGSQKAKSQTSLNAPESAAVVAGTGVGNSVRRRSGGTSASLMVPMDGGVFVWMRSYKEAYVEEGRKSASRDFRAILPPVPADPTLLPRPKIPGIFNLFGLPSGERDMAVDRDEPDSKLVKISRRRDFGEPLPEETDASTSSPDRCGPSPAETR